MSAKNDGLKSDLETGKSDHSDNLAWEVKYS